MGRFPVTLWLLQLCALVAADTVYVTDLTQYSSLAPCAQYAISYQVQGLTQSACPQGVTALASCACSKNNNAASVASAIATSVLDYCSSTASEDVASASAVFSRYCNQGGAAAAVTPAPTLVSQYISDVSAYSNLAPCAQSALYEAVFYLTESLCPNGQSALQSCACTKNQNSLAASERINSDVPGYCGSTATEDISSAQAIFAGYCGMGAGTTSFPSPGSISGSITYYITDLPNYSSLAPCAAYAVSEVIQQLTYSDCQSAPIALASCACYKNQNSAAISKTIVSSVQAQCSSTASADVTSALAVFDFYCNAAGGKVVASGVTASQAVATAGSGSSGGSGGSAASSSNNPRPVGTATSPGSTATAAGGSSPGSSVSSSSSSGSSTNVALIGGIVGGVGAVALIGIGLIIWFCRRKRHQPAPIPSTAGSSPNQDSKADVELHQYSKMSTPPLKPQTGTYEVPVGQGISEMPNQSAYVGTQGKYSAPSQYTKMSSPSMHTVSPVYEASGRPNVPEMGGQPNVSQIDGRPGVPEMPNNVGRPGIPEMATNMGPYQPQYQQQQQPGYPNQVYEMAPGQQQQGQQHELQPHALTSPNNAGPVPVYEMYSPDHPR